MLLCSYKGCFNCRSQLYKNLLFRLLFRKKRHKFPVVMFSFLTLVFESLIFYPIEAKYCRKLVSGSVVTTPIFGDFIMTRFFYLRYLFLMQ